MAGAYEVDTIKLGSYYIHRITSDGSTVNENYTVFPPNAYSYGDYAARIKFNQSGNSLDFSRMSNGRILQKTAIRFSSGVLRPGLNPSTMRNSMTITASGLIGGGQYDCVWADFDGSNKNPTGNAVTYTRDLQSKTYNEAGGDFGYYTNHDESVATGSVYNAVSNTYKMESNTSLTSYRIPLHVFFIPRNATSTVTVVNGRNTGVITDLGVIKVKASVADTLHIILDGAEFGTMDVQANVNTVVPLGSYSGKISKNAKHTLQLRSNYNGYLTEDKTTFTWMDTGIEVTGKPQAVERRPTACSLVTITDIPAGATAVWQVTNNANDDNPSWEIYEGDSHVFENTEATSGAFALSWKVNVDAGTATTQPKITEKVGMGVLYDEGD